MSKDKKIEAAIERANNVLSYYSKKKGVMPKTIQTLPLRNALETDTLASAQMGDNSLREKGIFKGDYVIFSMDEKINDGDLAIVELSGEMAIRIVRFIGDGLIKLESANPLFKSFTRNLVDTKLIARVMRTERDW